MLMHSKELLMGSGGEVDLAKSRRRNLFAGKNSSGYVKYLLDYWDTEKGSLIISPPHNTNTDTGNCSVTSLISGTLGRPNSVVRLSCGDNSKAFFGGWLEEDWASDTDFFGFPISHPGLIVYTYAYDSVTNSYADASAMCFQKNPYKLVNFWCEPDMGYGPYAVTPKADYFERWSGDVRYYRAPELDTYIDLS